ncbi:hypothetical protein ACOMHN_056955 [Nucella lapillus]
MDDTLYDNVLNYLKNGTYPLTAKGENRDVTKVKKRQLRKIAAKYTIREDVLYRDEILVAKRSQVPEILQEFHDNYVSGGHLGMNKTYKKSNFCIEDDSATSSSSRPRRLCDVCADDKEATHSCVQCQQRYCLPCRKYHDSVQSCYGHTVVSLTEEDDGCGKGAPLSEK